MSLYRKLTPAEVLAMVRRNTVTPAPAEAAPESITRNTDVSVAPEPEMAATNPDLARGALERAMGFLDPNKRVCGPKLTDLKAPTPAVAAAKTNARYKVGQAAYMRAYRARKKAEKADGQSNPGS